MTSSPLLNLKTLYITPDLLYDLAMGTMWGLVLAVLLANINNFLLPSYWSTPSDSDVVEIMSLVTPIILLLNVGALTFAGIYLENNLGRESLLIKVLGSQWLWTYEYSDYGMEVESFMTPVSELMTGTPALLTSSSPCVLPMETTLEFKLTSCDVLHSWAVPSMAIKSDCVPGTSFRIPATFSLPGTYYGMCSELCGSMHPFMPICLEVVAMLMFLAWMHLPHMDLLGEFE